MSLVHNALKKAEREKQRMVGGSRDSDAVPNGNLPASSADRGRGRLLPSLLAAIIVLCVAGPAAFYIVKRDQTRRPDPVQAVDLQETVVPVVVEQAVSGPHDAPKIDPEPQMPPPADSSVSAKEYKLTGIMKDADQKYLAVLNNRVVGVGGYVEGATVREIGGDRITIEVDGREQVLRLDGTTP